jgi:hypothetical protein
VALAFLPATLIAATCGSSSGPARTAKPSADGRPDHRRPSQFRLREVEALHPAAPERGRARPAASRNPFSFGAADLTGSADGSARPLPPPTTQGLQELPAPLPGPVISLLGIAVGREHPPVRTAVLSVGGDLVLAHVGDRLAGRYTVTAIGEGSVDLADLPGERPVHLVWQ